MGFGQIACSSLPVFSLDQLSSLGFGNLGKDFKSRGFWERKEEGLLDAREDGGQG